MSIGGVARSILGKKLFPVVGRYYRSIFVDLRKVARIWSDHLPKGAFVLDIGGGDGEPLNHLLALRPDIRVCMIDLSPAVGQSVRNEYLQRVTLMPGTSIREYFEDHGRRPDAVLISDVLHHIPLDARLSFFTDLRELAATQVKIIVKDIEPKGARALLSWLSDRFISGDRNVNLIPEHNLKLIMKGFFGQRLKVVETPLYEEDRPNYCLVFYNEARPNSLEQAIEKLVSAEKKPAPEAPPAKRPSVTPYYR